MAIAEVEHLTPFQERQKFIYENQLFDERKLRRDIDGSVVSLPYPKKPVPNTEPFPYNLIEARKTRQMTLFAEGAAILEACGIIAFHGCAQDFKAYEMVEAVIYHQQVKLEQLVADQSNLVDFKVTKDMTLLALAVALDNKQAVEFLAGNIMADTGFKTSGHRHNLLHIAVLCRSYDCIPALLKGGVDFKARDAFGRTAYDYVLELEDQTQSDQIIRFNEAFLADKNFKKYLEKSGKPAVDATPVAVASAVETVSISEVVQKAAPATEITLDARSSIRSAFNAAAADITDNKRKHILPPPYYTISEKETYMPGQLVEDEGIYLGKWSPKDKKGVSLGKIFNVFAAPEDLPNTMTYSDTIEYIGKLKNWHGHDGFPCKYEEVLYDSLRDRSYQGGWVMPPVELMIGFNGIYDQVQSDNFVAHWDKGAFKKAFNGGKVEGYNLRANPAWYWSSTLITKNYHSDALIVEISEGLHDFSPTSDKSLLSCHPIRLVEVKP